MTIVYDVMRDDDDDDDDDDDGAVLKYIYIYIRHRAFKAHRACLIQWHILQASEKEGGRRSSSLGASRSRIYLVATPRRTFFCLFVRAFFRTSIFEPKGAKRLP